MKNIIVFDNGGKTIDRYIIVIGKDVYTMSHNPNSPVGVNMYAGELDRDVFVDTKKFKKLNKIPNEIKDAVKQRMNENNIRKTIKFLVKEELQNLNEDRFNSGLDRNIYNYSF